VKKIPTVFERDWDGDRSRVLDVVHPGCEWVIAGEGVPTQKIDGTACLVRDGVLYKRFALPEGRVRPDGFLEEEWEGEEGKRKLIGWVPVGDGPDDRWHREAFLGRALLFPDGTYELVGPKIQGNPEQATEHTLVRHGDFVLDGVPRDFAGLAAYLASVDMEGIVWHHEDGRMAKIKARDFGIRRPKP
jgi:hypothetical protein